MKIILDTHIFLWALSEPERIGSARLREIETRANAVYVSSISIAEIMIKASLNKLSIDFDPIETAEKSGFEFLDFSAGDAALLKTLPFHHKDPFDRMIISQCLSRNFYLISDDHKFRFYNCKLI